MLAATKRTIGYAETTCSLDDLPYTEEFEQLYSQFLSRTGLIIERHYIWKALCNCRKAGKLVRKRAIMGAPSWALTFGS
jgi:hypothetical protein